MASKQRQSNKMERKKGHSSGHFLAKYVHATIPGRNPVEDTGNMGEVNIRLSAYRVSFSRRVRVQVPETRDQQTEHPIPSYSEGRYHYELNWCPPPVCMVLFSLLEVTMFVADAAVGRVDATGPAALVFIYHPQRRREAWRFLSYMLVHVGILHLILNLVVQVFLGIALELVHLWWRVLLIYLAGVLAGSLATSLSDPALYLAGASAGVYALVASHVATVILNWSLLVRPYIQILLFALMMATDLAMAIYLRYYSPVRMHIGYVAHLAGAAAGLLVGIGVLRNLQNRKAERRVWWCAVGLYSALMVAGVVANISWAGHFPPQLI